MLVDILVVVIIIFVLILSGLIIQLYRDLRKDRIFKTKQPQSSISGSFFGRAKEEVHDESTSDDQEDKFLKVEWELPAVGDLDFSEMPDDPDEALNWLLNMAEGDADIDFDMESPPITPSEDDDILCDALADESLGLLEDLGMDTEADLFDSLPDWLSLDDGRSSGTDQTGWLTSTEDIDVSRWLAAEDEIRNGDFDDLPDWLMNAASAEADAVRDIYDGDSLESSTETDRDQENLLLLRLDTAVPEEVYIGDTFEIAVAIRQMTSPYLDEPGLSQRKRRNFQVEWLATQISLRLQVTISAPDCEIVGPSQITFKLHRGQDSPDFYFQLTPHKEGVISIIITVFQESDWLGSARVHTTALTQITSQVAVTDSFTSQTLCSDHRMRLHGNIIHSFNLEELRLLCLSLRIQHEEFSNTLSPFARELIEYCYRRQILDNLIHACHTARPNIYWQFDSAPVA